VLLLVAVTLAWAASYPRHMLLGYDGPRWHLFLQIVDGECAVLFQASATARRAYRGLVAETDAWTQRLSDFVKGTSLYRETAAALGFGYVEMSVEAVDGGATTQRGVWLPMWSVWLPLAWVAAVRARRTLRLRRRRRDGLCVACGYDLRGSADRCPECGLARHPPSATTTVGVG
jgi:hypothetical protein